MKLTLVALAGAASAAGFNGTTITVPHTITTTTVVNEYTTYCPEPTTITEGDKTITVTEPGTITITDCPCTRTTTKTTYSLTTKPIYTKPSESKPVESHPVESKPAESHPVESKPVESKPVESKPVESKPAKTTESPWATPVHPTANITITSTKPPVSQGDAAAVGISGALAGVAAAVAYFL